VADFARKIYCKGQKKKKKNLSWITEKSTEGELSFSRELCLLGARKLRPQTKREGGAASPSSSSKTKTPRQEERTVKVRSPLTRKKTSLEDRLGGRKYLRKQKKRRLNVENRGGDEKPQIQPT